MLRCEEVIAMPPLVLETPGLLKDYVGRELAVTDWFPVTQERIQQFADATGDHQWIHVDRERAQAESPFGTTIAHGFLTLSLLSHFMQQALQIRGSVRLAVNYGLNKVRFPAPARVGSKLRARVTLRSLKEIRGAREAVFSVAVEVEGGEKPCCVAEWIVLYYS
ncbi:MAG TPA: MaoC family dehydratase [Terriglobales bacterium]|nr:MaoC family dehydratase [Terriglobales bacterium]